jgi:DNA-binding NarL/FixJ family response regulator
MSIQSIISVVVADDHPTMRSGIRRVLEADPEISVVGEGANGDEALRLTRSLMPHVLVLDVEMPGRSGLDVARELAAEGSPTRILAFSAYTDRAYINGLLAAGISGYITKEKDPSLVVEAVKAIARGEDRWFVSVKRQEAAAPSLSERELEVLTHMARGRSKEEIAGILTLSPFTVRNHVTSVYSKLGVKSWREAVAWAWQNGVIQQ